MSGCPLWRPDCQVGAAANAAVDVVTFPWRAANAATSAAASVNDAVGGIARFGGLIALALVVLLLWGLWKMLGFGASAAVGVADAYTGGAVSKTLHERRTKGPRRAGRTAGREFAATKRRNHGAARGPQPTFHSGVGNEVIHRTNDKAGRPARVTVCAADAGAAFSLLGDRMQGHQWRPAGVKACDLSKPATKGAQPAHRHFTFTRS